MSSFDGDLADGELIELHILDTLLPEIAESFERLTTRAAQHDEGDVKATIPGIRADIPINIKPQTTYINNPKAYFVLD